MLPGTRTRTRAHAHARARARTHARTQTHTHTHTYNQTDQLWPPPDTANSMHCLTLLLLSRPAPAALLTRLCDASLPWAVPATLRLCYSCISTVCFVNATDCIIIITFELQPCQACQPWHPVCLCCSARQGNPAQHQ